MYEELNAQLSEASQAQRSRDKLRADLQRAEEDLRRQRLRLQELQAIADQEDRDVRRLEGLSMTALFLTILGSKEDQLQKERQEYLSAHLKSRQAQHAVQVLEGDVERLQYELGRLSDVDTHLQALLEQKETLLARSGDATARRLAELAEQLGEARSQLKEVGEAIAAGMVARKGIDQVLSDLHSAHSCWAATCSLRRSSITASMTRARQYIRFRMRFSASSVSWRMSASQPSLL